VGGVSDADGGGQYPCVAFGERLLAESRYRIHFGYNQLNLEGREMSADRKTLAWQFGKVFLILNVLINFSPVLIWIPVLAPVLIFLTIIWLHIPGLIFAPILGESHFKPTDLASAPISVLAWAAVILFWQLVAAMVTVFIMLPRMLWQFLTTAKASGR
jgi:hypothetical protein